jgi:outer membrane lipoprotein-sorting protein
MNSPNLNPEISYYTDVKAGQTISLPSTYGKKIDLLIDTESLLPVSIEVHDEKGFFEAYSFHAIELNPQIDQSEFTPDFEEYGF